MNPSPASSRSVVSRSVPGDRFQHLFKDGTRGGSLGPPRLFLGKTIAPLPAIVQNAPSVRAEAEHQRPVRAKEASRPVCTAVQPVLALLADRVGANPTQFMVERALAHLQLDWRYLSLEVPSEGLQAALAGMWVMGFQGGNLDGLHKQNAASLLHHLGTVAQRTGVVNCLVRRDEAFCGENTEGRAVLEVLRRHRDPAGLRVAVLGAGRAAKAAALELALAGAGEILVVARSPQAGQQTAELVAQVPAHSTYVPWEGTWQVPEDVEIVIDATSHARSSSTPWVAVDRLGPQCVLAGMDFQSPRPELLHQASQKGATVIDGLEVFVEQVAINFRLWTGMEAQRSVLREAAEEFLEL